MSSPPSLLARSRSHLAAAGESYFEHLRFAAAVGTSLLVAALCCLVHAVVPGLFEDRASKAVIRIEALIKDRRDQRGLARLRGETDGLLTLFALSAVAMILPWLIQAHPVVSASLSLLAFGVPAAAVKAGTEPDEAAPPLLLPAPARPAPARRRIVILGGGFSGTALALQLARQDDVEITLVDRRGAGRGLAYSTRSANHLLNVRAAKMSAHADDPGHFTAWLQARGLGGAYDFVPRRLYGDYLEGQLADAVRSAEGRLRVVTGEAVALRRGDGRAALRLADGDSLAGDAIVLAGTNLPPRRHEVLDDAGIVAPGPWSEDLAAGLGATDQVLILGTGLTMVDSVIALTDAGFAGQILAVSRHGLAPRAHRQGPEAKGMPAYVPGLRLTELLRTLRQRAAKVGWRAAMDELRPGTPALWQALPADQQARFLRHGRAMWDAHRHRMAPAAADRIQGLIAEGRLRLIAGRLERAERAGDQVAVRLRLRGLAYHESLSVARIVNCMGPDADLARSGDPLLSRLLADGAIRPDRHRLGLEVAADGAVIGADDSADPRLFALGPLARGRSWEMTAVPELRSAAAALAVRLARVPAAA